MHFGLEGLVPITMYAAGIVAALLALFKSPVYGLYYLTPLIPLQTLRYRLNDFPLGQSVVDVILIAVILGLLRQGRSLRPRTPLDGVLLAYGVYTLVSLFWGSFYMKLPLPLSPADPRLADWKNVIEMLVIMYLVASSVRNNREMLVLMALMCFGALLLDRSFWGNVSSQDFSTYSNALRDEGSSIGYAGVNGLAAFEAQWIVTLLGFNAFKHRWWIHLACLGLIFFSALCLMYSLSRGGYAALLVGWVFIGLVRMRTLIVILVVFLLTWTTLVPTAVQQRVFMTYDADRGFDRTSMQRVRLWDDAMEVARTNPLFGSGYNTYAYMGRVGSWKDTHNIYLKVLVETGFIGLGLFVLMLWRLFRLGWSVYRFANDPLKRALGLGLCGWMVSTAVANIFGDAWTFLQVDGYLWLLAGLVCRAWILEREKRTELEDAQSAADGDVAGTPELSPA